MLVEKLLSQNKVFVECEILKAKNHKLSKALQNFTNSKNKVNDMLENKHNFQNRKGLGFGIKK